MEKKYIDLKLKENTKRQRLEWLDTIRGLTLISMIIYHAVWDIVYIAKVDWSWFESGFFYFWQQSICWTFILLSGFSWSLGSRGVKRGGIVTVAGILVSAVTVLFTPEERIVFGVLTFLGAAMLLMIPMEKLLYRVPKEIGAVISFALFIALKSMNRGYLAIEGIARIKLPDSLYHQGYVMTFLGFTDTEFFSTDYFSMLPWIFLFITGYFLYRIFEQQHWLEKSQFPFVGNKHISILGRHSLLIYLVHQPIIYAGVVLGKTII